MTKPPSLFQEVVDFDKKKRQLFLFERYYEGYSRFFQTELMSVHVQNIQDNQGNPEWMTSVYRKLSMDMFEYWQLRYTGGEPIEVLRKEFDQVLAVFEKKAEAERLFEHQEGWPAFELDQIDDYVQYVALLSISILLRREELIPRIHALIADSELDKEDALIEELLSRYLPDRPYLDEWFHEEPYRYLLDATAGDTPEEKLADLKTYLKKWYVGMKGVGWYNAHKEMTDEGGGGYFGYWAWEAGAIAYLHDIDDSTVESMYYPKDLVAFARSMPKSSLIESAELKQTDQLRCEAGLPCPKSGAWSSPAYTEGTRRFQQGEVMPHIEGNPWGATIWHFVGE
jgi:hypothetical protein